MLQDMPSSLHGVGERSILRLSDRHVNRQGGTRTATLPADDRGDGGLAAEASQKPKLALEVRCGARTPADRNEAATHEA